MVKLAQPFAAGTGDPRKEATIRTLKRVLDPLVDLMFDSGVTVREFNQLLRERAVRGAAARVSREIGRDSKSRVSIATGLPRSEVSRILRSDDAYLHKRLGQHPARKVLGAWFDDRRFLSANGDPAVLPIFGKKRSFQQLVAMHSGGIPVRAMLDELTQIDAVERLADQKVKAKSRVPIFTGLTASAIEAIGERTRDLLETLTYNLRRKSKPLFEGTAITDDIDPELVSLIRREIAEQGANLVNSTNSLFGRSRIKQNRPIAKGLTKKCRLGITVFYFQDGLENEVEAFGEKLHGRRRNLQRRPLKRKRTGNVVSHPHAKVQP
jgi:uncharacterized protein DUF6502